MKNNKKKYVLLIILMLLIAFFFFPMYDEPYKPQKQKYGGSPAVLFL